jgi:choline dehydrogenase-like flavoprotein
MTEASLSPRQRAVLAAICDTLIPPIEREDDPAGFFRAGAAEAGTIERVERLVGLIEDPGARARLKLLLDMLGHPAANLVLSGHPGAFHRMPPERRLAVLRGWAHSRLAPKRAGFQALKRLTQVAYYGWPVRNGTGHPAWSAAGYPGPLPQPVTGLEPFPTHSIAADTTLDCDAVIVGSGPGGGVAAALLAEAGRTVVVLDKGPNPGARDLTHVEGEALGSYYLDHGLMMTHSGSLPILAGSCLGGGSVINYTTSFKLPDATRTEWAERSSLTLFTSARFTEALDRVWARIGAGRTWSTPGCRDQVFERGLRALGWHVDVMDRAVRDCREGLECGYCGYGCRHDAKTASSYLRDAAAAGARLIPDCEVSRVVIERGRATGVEGVVRAADGRRHVLRVRARAVIVACGTIYTPAVLARSGLGNPNIGRGLRLHPGTGVIGFFPERIEPWSGTIQTRYSDQFADLDGRGYGAKLETVPIHFAMPASALGWEHPRQMKEDLARLGHLGMVGILLRDRDPGRVVVGRDGRPRAHYELSAYDVRHVRRAVRGAAELLAAAGATEIVSVQTPPARARPGGAGWLERFGADADRRGYTRGRMSYITFHQMGTCAMGRYPQTSVVGETGETHDVRGLYVADSSAFVTSSGVNPMVTIMAIADHVARGILETW